MDHTCSTCRSCVIILVYIYMLKLKYQTTISHGIVWYMYMRNSNHTQKYKVECMRSKEAAEYKVNDAHVFLWHTFKGTLAVARSCSMPRYVWSMLLLGVFQHLGCLYTCICLVWVGEVGFLLASVLYTFFSCTCTYH